MEKLVKKTNILLQKDDIGKSKPCTVKLPNKAHAYGKADIKDAAGAGVITSSWVVHQPSKNTISQQKDFRKINKLGLQSRDIDVKVSIKYSKSLDIICISDNNNHKFIFITERQRPDDNSRLEEVIKRRPYEGFDLRYCIWKRKSTTNPC